MADSGEYDEDARRIDREYVPSGATTREEVQRALEDAGFPEASQTHIIGTDSDPGWLETSEDAWDAVGPNTQDAGSVRRALDRDGGVASPSRADSIADDVGSEIQSARARAAQRVTDDGQVRTEGGQFLGKLQNVEEEVRDDGIYFRNTNTGSEGRAARFNR